MAMTRNATVRLFAEVPIRPLDCLFGTAERALPVLLDHLGCTGRNDTKSGDRHGARVESAVRQPAFGWKTESQGVQVGR